MKRLIGVLVVALLAVMVGWTTASAAGPELQEGRAPGVVAQQAGEVEDGFLGRGELRDRLGQRIRILSDLLDMTPQEIADALRDGQTIADLAAEQGVPLEEVEAALAAPRQERLASLVDEDILNQEQANYLNTRADERLNDFITMPPRRAFRQKQLEDLATVLDMSEAEIVAAIADGVTPAEIIVEQGAGAGEVIAEMVSLRDADLSELVALDLMSETQKNVALYHYEQRLTARLAP